MILHQPPHSSSTKWPRVGVFFRPPEEDNYYFHNQKNLPGKIKSLVFDIMIRSTSLEL